MPQKLDQKTIYSKVGRAAGIVTPTATTAHERALNGEGWTEALFKFNEWMQKNTDIPRYNQNLTKYRDTSFTSTAKLFNKQKIIKHKPPSRHMKT